MSPISAAKKLDPSPAAIPMLIGGEWRAASETYEVFDPYRGSVFEIVPRSTLAELNDALSAAVAAKAKIAHDLTEERMVLFNY